jgi:membrane protein YqaA with SNARE-associated domain
MIVPPIPADTFVLLGAFLSAHGRTSPWVVFFVTWGANVGAAIAVYLLARRYGDPFFETKVGRFLLNRKQMVQIGRFYDKYGMVAIFFSRFLPAFRAMVPVFAGVTDKPAIRVLPPLALASGLCHHERNRSSPVGGRGGTRVGHPLALLSTVLAPAVSETIACARRNTWRALP